MTTTYSEWLNKKTFNDTPNGITGDIAINKKLFPFQADIVKWALRRGRAAIFADCGLGKTPMQLEWAAHIPGDVLILAPLAVTSQTVREGNKFGIPVNPCRKQADIVRGINITNYEMLDHFDPGSFQGIVLDESSILKSYDGKTRTSIIDAFEMTPFRMACTATPSPNDYMELGNHSEFLGIMTRSEMLSMFFIHDGGETQKWRLKGHGEGEFWKWIAQWAVNIRKPSDLGYDDDGFKLPKINFIERAVRATNIRDGLLFPIQASSLQERILERRNTVHERVMECANIIKKSNSDDQWLVWCNLNQEGDLLEKRIKGSTQVSGNDSNDKKEKAIVEFTTGQTKILISKSTIFGFGLNLQNCHNVIFVGLSDSYEQFYQAVRRCWRFGQKRQVNVYIVIADTEGAVLSNIKRKEEDAMRMADNMLNHMKDLNKQNIHDMATRQTSDYRQEKQHGDGWEFHLGDCVDIMEKFKDSSFHYSIYSPPFASLYTYSNSNRDMGNCKDMNEFMEHYKFFIKELLRVTMDGRLTSFHCMNLPTSKVRDGFIGIRDFRGMMIRLYEEAGWIFHSEVCIWKDPVTAMQRTKALGLLHKQIKKDSCMSRQGIPDYLITMRKPGDNPERVTHTNESFPVSIWQNYASPVWMDINPSDTLQFRAARENNDERHISPLQLEVIKRALQLWTNPSDLILSPFAGIGSEGYVAIKYGRRFVGIELKKSYFDVALKNLINIEKEKKGALGV